MSCADAPKSDDVAFTTKDTKGRELIESTTVSCTAGNGGVEQGADLTATGAEIAKVQEVGGTRK